jgi:hypothetical protein
MGHGIVLNRIVPYYGSGKKLRHTIGYTGCADCVESEWNDLWSNGRAMVDTALVFE